MKAIKKWCSFVNAVLFAVLLPVSAQAGQQLPFSDVKESAWYYDAVVYTYENKLFQGTTSTTFSPDSPMTRAMFIQVLANKTSNYQKEDYQEFDVFLDVRKQDWFAPAVMWAYDNGLAGGVSASRFDPNGKITREQIAKILYLYAEKTRNDISFSSAAFNSFSDKGSVSSFAKEGIRWATTHGIINGSAGRLYPKSSATRAQVARMFQNAETILVKHTLIG